MESPPHVDGLPVWAQIVVSVLIGIGGLITAFSGYFKKGEKGSTSDAQTTSLVAASIADMGAIRQLSDVCIRLSGNIDVLTQAVEEHTHHERNNVEVSREICQRLRELKEELERQGRDARAWDKRDEGRR